MSDLKKRTIDGLNLIEKISNQIIKADDIEEILKRIVNGAIELTNADTGVIFLLSKDKKKVIYSFHPPGDFHAEPRLNKEEGITRRVIRTKGIVRFKIIEEKDNINPAIKKKYVSMIAVPLIVDEEVEGVLFQNYLESYKLDDILIKFLSVLANLGAMLIKSKNKDELHTSTLNLLPQRVFRKDVNSRFIWANKKFLKSIGKKIDEIIGKNDLEIFTNKKLAKKYIEDDKKIIETRIPYMDKELHQTDNMEHPIWVEVNKFPFYNSMGEIIGIQAIFWDINDEHIAKERHKSLVEQSPDSILVHRNRKVFMANKAAYDLFQYPEGELIGKDIIKDLIHKDFHEDAEKRMERVRNNQKIKDELKMKVVTAEIEEVTAENKTIEVIFYSRKSPKEDNVIQTVIHDLTKLNLLIREMYHRLMTNLANVSAFLDMEVGKSQEEVQIYEKTQNRIQAMSIVHYMLSHTKEGKVIPFESYLRDLCDGILRSFGISDSVNVDINAANIYLGYEKSTICGLIITELITNSIKHAFDKDRGSIEIKMECIGQRYLLNYRDNGRGMKNNYLNLSEYKGLGIVNSLINSLGGNYSIDINNGLVFDFFIPKRK